MCNAIHYSILHRKQDGLELMNLDVNDIPVFTKISQAIKWSVIIGEF